MPRTRMPAIMTPLPPLGDVQISLLSNLRPVFRVGRLQFVYSPL